MVTIIKTVAFQGIAAVLVDVQVQIARELVAIYHPSCNPEQYDPAWKDEWIGEYNAPTTRPLTTGRNPASPGVEDA